jgi:hypothetical protein
MAWAVFVVAISMISLADNPQSARPSRAAAVSVKGLSPASVPMIMRTPRSFIQRTRPMMSLARCSPRRLAMRRQLLLLAVQTAMPATTRSATVRSS